jgi:hypothetical protein
MIMDDKRGYLKDTVDINLMSVVDGTRVAVSTASSLCCVT